MSKFIRIFVRVNSHWTRHASRYPSQHGINQWNECYDK